MSDLPLDEAALDRAKKRIEHGDWPADNTLHALVAQSRAALTLRARVAELRARGVSFVESGRVHSDDRGALTQTQLGGVPFELVHHPRG